MDYEVVEYSLKELLRMYPKLIGYFLQSGIDVYDENYIVRVGFSDNRKYIDTIEVGYLSDSEWLLHPLLN